ncbi:Panacea domain-containing protein [uncultured Legionella sp.]|uniref:Panacea domain-containing protein n=1 Tax=uncultured Legionella sp. TaxID=210934 RepID=UPI0026032EF5|nr:Panacea domain-containing protein [uncultured Legionella sp.]
MSNILKEVIAFILKQYPYKDDLSNARMTKIIYLADWHQAINYKKQITNINWYFDNYGPFVQDVINEVNANPNLFGIKNTNNYYGGTKNLFFLKLDNYEPIEIAERQKESLCYIIEITKTLTWDNFINLVYSTYPITSSERYSYLNLVQKANEYARGT